MKDTVIVNGKESILQKIHISIFVISIAAVTAMLMGWPTASGPYKLTIEYFVILSGLLILLSAYTIKFNSKIPGDINKFMLQRSFLLFLGFAGALLTAEITARVFKFAEFDAGQGPLQPYYQAQRYKLNSKGFRGPEINLIKEKGKIRVIGLGDSNNFGTGAEWEDIYLEQLKNKLNTNTKSSFETINFGKVGWNTVQEAEFFAKEGLPYKPDILILLYCLNDPELSFYLLKPITNSDLEVQYLWRSHLYFCFIKAYNKLVYPYDKYMINLFKDGSDTAKFNQQALNSISKLCRNIGIKPVLVILPVFKGLRNYQFTNLHKKVREWGQMCNYDVIDLLPVYAKYSATGEEFRVSSKDWHPNKEGHRIIAEEVYKKILEDYKY